MAILKRFLISYNNDRWHQGMLWNTSINTTVRKRNVLRPFLWNFLMYTMVSIVNVNIFVADQWLKLVPCEWTLQVSKKAQVSFLFFFLLPPWVRVALGKNSSLEVFQQNILIRDLASGSSLSTFPGKLHIWENISLLQHF